MNESEMSPQPVVEFTKESAAKDFHALGVQEGDTVLVQSGFRNFRMIRGGPTALIEALLMAVGKRGTLIMPTFNWVDFGEKKFYSKKNTKPQTGLLSELFAEWPGRERIYHPIHGFSLVGENAKQLAQKVKNKSSFEEASLFGELYRMNARLMLLGVSYREGFSFFHYLEEAIGVPYRKFLNLKGIVEELDGSVRETTIPYYGRTSMQVDYDIDKIIPFLEGENNSLIKKRVIGKGVVRLMSARPVYERLAHVLRENPNLILVGS